MMEMAWTPYHTQLSAQLATLYLDRDTAQRLATQAGIMVAYVTFSDNAANNWHEIVREAEAQGRLIPLIEQALKERKTNKTLQELHDKLLIPQRDAMAAIQQYNVPTLSALVDNLKRRIPNAPETWYFTFRLQFMRLEMKDAIDSLDHLLRLPLLDGDLPLKIDQLRDLQTTLHFWNAALLLFPSDPTPPIEVTMLMGKDEDHLEEAKREKLFLGDTEFNVPQIEYGAITRFAVVNRGSNPAHLYFVKVMADGQVHVGALLKAPESFTGVEAGKRGEGPVFPAVDTPSVIETRLFYSPKRIDKMLAPVTPGVQRLQSAWINENDVEGVKLMRFWFQVTDPT